MIDQQQLDRWKALADDATFIAAAREAVPALVEELERQIRFAAEQYQAGYDHAVASILHPEEKPPYDTASLLTKLAQEREAHGMCEARVRQLQWQLEKANAEVERLRARLVEVSAYAATLLRERDAAVLRAERAEAKWDAIPTGALIDYYYGSKPTDYDARSADDEVGAFVRALEKENALLFQTSPRMP